MTKNLLGFLVILVLSMALASSAVATGEEILGRTGQYTFFIKPLPCDSTTYYQKMVPCVAREMVLVPRVVMRTLPLPVSARRPASTVITETPIGCAQGAEDCVTCYPQPSSRPGTKDLWGPRPIPVPVAYYEFTPREITRRVMLPQWFAVTEEVKQPRKIRKVGIGG
jgi:hypothetical protein